MEDFGDSHSLDDSIYEAIQYKEMSAMILKSLDQMEKRYTYYGRCLALRYYMELPPREIAAMLDISTEYCKKILLRAKKKLASVLSEDKKRMIYVEQFTQKK